ncbi:hypothetical protein KSD_90030 [Ktedonobacter sp. SOSP1-85]|uniref:hypothetical protein n=1 Tax=Ktedonobacter sp. SOSP1-85 TaxID=2778367 RepID=UPI00191505B4|nr:hypothetical protein [Ktedonobacter sp. SOSP1-85]GHO81232.1 hypothetical protein KSD_90030 [Ktedonobacter sp. SOSP1-85]
MATQTFTVLGRRPHIVLEDIEGNVTVLPWEREEIAIETAEPVQGIQQEGERLYIRGYRSDITLRVPFIRNILSRLTTSITASRINGSVSTDRVGSVELRQVSGNVNLEQTHGSVRLEDLSELARLHSVGGSLTVVNASYIQAWGGVGGSVSLRYVRVAEVDNVGGSFDAQNVDEKLICKHVGGSTTVLGCQNAEVEVGSTGGSVNIDGAAVLHSVSAGGSATLTGTFSPGSHNRIAAGGSATLTLPANSDIAVNAIAGGSVSGSALERRYGQHANVVYGNGSASLMITAGGRVTVNGDLRPSR